MTDPQIPEVPEWAPYADEERDMGHEAQQLSINEQGQVATTPQGQDAGTIMQVISRAASDPNTDVDKLERLMGMYERIESRQAEVAFHAALSELQSNLPEITERGEIRHKGNLISRYALWEDVNKAIKPVLRDHGFSLSFRVNTDNQVRVEGVLSHQQGHSERTVITLPADTSGSKNPVQAVASSVSYGKRYVAAALLNLTTGGEDDDAQTAHQQPRLTDSQISKLTELLDATESDEALFLRWAFSGQVPEGATVADLPQTMYERCERKLQAKLKSQQEG